MLAAVHGHGHGLLGAGPEPLRMGALFVTGLAVSLGHCTGMCGPLIGAFAASRGRGGEKRLGRLPELALYQAGRVASYVLIGTLLALAGSATSLLGPEGLLKVALSLAAGALMILLGLGLLGLLPVARWVEQGALARRVTSLMARLLRSDFPGVALLLGVANGLLPCAPVAAVALGAAGEASAGRGALAMLAYGLGTVPVTLLLGVGASLLGPAARHRFHRLAAALMMLIGLQLALRGLAGAGIVGHARLGGLVLW